MVIHVLKGGKTLRVEVFCENKKAAEEIVTRFGGRVKQLKNADWQKPAEIPASERCQAPQRERARGAKLRRFERARELGSTHRADKGHKKRPRS